MHIFHKVIHKMPTLKVQKFFEIKGKIRCLRNKSKCNKIQRDR